MKGSGRIRTGKQGEEIAAAYLAGEGYRIVDRNYRCLFGEVDIVAKDKDTIVFIEVKSRKSDLYGDPQTAVSLEKQKKLCRISLKYLEERHLYPCDARFDVVAVKMLPAGNQIELIRNAFDFAF